MEAFPALRLIIVATAFLTALTGGLSTGRAAVATGVDDYQLFARSNLVAWCIVPFDGKERGPEARAEMLERLGFSLFAYDYRAQHIPTFDAEMEALQRHHIRLLAWWFPTTLNDEARQILGVLKRHESVKEPRQPPRFTPNTNRWTRIARAFWTK